MDEVTSKHIDGITDLVVIAPIKDGFIQAYENITYASRLKLVAEALNRIRVAAREYERVVPYSDVTERILNLLDFRVGVLDKDLFGLSRLAPGELALGSRRYLYLTATFEGGWEPYMRLIWKPLGPFLDLLFCNCDGYVTATEHSCEEYLQWVRDNQMDSAIFYNTTGLSTRDQKYLSRLERLQREGADDLQLASARMLYPEPAATETRRQHAPKTLELGLEALNVIYKLADFYPPEWLTGRPAGTDPDGRERLNEGHRLVRAAGDILLGWDHFIAGVEALPEAHPLRQVWTRAQAVYAEPLAWYTSGKRYLARLDAELEARRLPDPPFELGEVQGGILKAQGSAAQPVQHGALLLFTIRDAGRARDFIAALDPHFAAGPGSTPADGIYRTVGFTPDGLLRLGLDYDVVDCFPKEFREGMEQRSGLLGDQRENHPRNWILPERNGPALTGAVPLGTRLPRVELREVDIVVQLRTSAAERAVLEVEARRLATLAGQGASLEAVEWLTGAHGEGDGYFRDHFGYLDGISQPRPRLPGIGDNSAAVLDRDRVRPGEVLLGYGNDRGDSAPAPFVTLDDWRRRPRQEARELQLNGTFLVVRKIGEDVARFDAWLDQSAAPIAAQLGIDAAAARALLKAAVMGRDEAGRPLARPDAGGLNDFDYGQDGAGRQCPFAAHIRRANPRRIVPGGNVPPLSQDETLTRAEFDRPTPRLLRRAMLFGHRQDGPDKAGLMFMAYNASIAEQYEVIQRWLNGGNSTDQAAANNDPLTGVLPKDPPGLFQFIASDAAGQPQVVRVPLPAFTPAPGLTGGSEPGRHPFTPLHWGLYLFVPSRRALDRLARIQGRFRLMRKFLEDVRGRAVIERVEALPAAEAAKEWKRLLEDFVTKDPAERDVTPDMWSAIRYFYGGALNLRRGPKLPGGIAVPDALNLTDEPGDEPAGEGEGSFGHGYDWANPDRASQNVVLVAGRDQVAAVLADWRTFSSEEQLRRIHTNSGPIFVTQQPDDAYNNPALNALGLNYRSDATATNAILLHYGEADGFRAGYAAGSAVLKEMKLRVQALGRTAFKLELRRQYLLPALGVLCKLWYGLPDDLHMALGGWSWQPVRLDGDGAYGADPAAPGRDKAHCPGDFLSPSRNAFYPRPSPEVTEFADNHGKAILAAARAFVAEHRAAGSVPQGSVAAAMFGAIADDEVLARNLVGTMVGAIPPMDGNLRGILAEWLGEKSLWRHQSALKRATGGRPAGTAVAEAIGALKSPVSQAMCVRPAPDLLYRTAQRAATIAVDPPTPACPHRRDIQVREGDLVVVSQVSASQRSLFDPDMPDGDVSIVFGGKRQAADQVDSAAPYPVHACPAQNMAFGAIMGIMAALLDAGTIQAMPAALIVRLSDWEPVPPPAA